VSLCRAGSAAELRRRGYQLLCWEEEGEEPEHGDKRFADYIPGLRGKAGLRLYRHQVEAAEALEAGENIVLTARTGSGKTEAWALPAVARGWRVLAVYPTLALSADQIRRLEEYSRAAGRGGVVRLDRPTLSRQGLDTVSRRILAASIVVTNPAFLLAELKRIAERRGVLEPFLSRLDLIVLDELDFYGPRSAHLLLACVELIAKHLSTEPPRVAVLTATLGNPGELADYLSRVTGRRTRIITGKPFRVRNATIIVLGKQIDALRRYVQMYSGIIASKAPWILELLRDEEEFNSHAYEVYKALKAMNLAPPKPVLDPVEVIAATSLRDKDGVTLVFTKSIRTAESIYRRLLEETGAEDRVAVHHHLVPKRVREEVEEAARRGEVRVIVTVRTLSQGIDIGTIRRVIHVGLPMDLREYLQREGRKGRRRELGYTETIIIPGSLWDRRLLEAGAETLRKWLTLPLEKLFINPENRYAVIFKAMWRLLRGLPLEEGEEEVLRHYDLVELIPTITGPRLSLNRRGKSFWRMIGFYEHGPPYGYRKYGPRGELLGEEEVSKRDVVEHYQPGSIDPVNDKLVVEVDTRRRVIVEDDIVSAAERVEWAAKALQHYTDVRRSWGERPDIEADIRYGRLYSIVSLRVEAPRRGFGEFLEEPLETGWMIESRRPRLSGRGAAVRAYNEIHYMRLEAPCVGRYRGYTYGLLVEAPPDVHYLDVLRAGASMLVAALRLIPEYSLPLGLLRYKVVKTASMRLIHFWEEEAAGVLEKLDWLGLAERVRRLSGEEARMAAILAASIDPSTGILLLSGRVELDDALEAAALIAEAAAATQVLRGSSIILKHPPEDPGHGVAGLAVLQEPVRDEGALIVAAWYDGGGEAHVESWRTGTDVSTALSAVQELARMLDQLLAKGYRVYVYGREQMDTLRRILSLSYMGAGLLSHAVDKGLLLDASTRLPKELKGRPVLVELEPRLADYMAWIERVRARGDTESLEKALRVAAATIARLVYRIGLALEKGSITVSRKASRPRSDPSQPRRAGAPPSHKSSSPPRGASRRRRTSA